MASILEGIKVLEWTVWQQGPLTGAMLGDLGAEVIKIEDRTGDIGRQLMAMIGAWLGVEGRDFYFEYNNRNKRGLCLDLQKEEARQIVYKLIKNTDVFIQNFRMGVAEKMGMDYETLSKYNPGLIYAHGTGWGPKGPDAKTPSMDYTGLGRTGLMYVGGEPGDPPVNYQPGLGDQMGAIFTAYGIMGALFARERTGEGQKIDVSLLGSVTCGLEGLHLSCKTILGKALPRTSRKKSGNPLYNHYECKDGKWLIICHAESDRYWPQFCKFLGIEDLEKDPRFESHNMRAKNGAELVAIIDKIFATKDREEWFNILREDPDFMIAPITTLSELEDDPQMWANDYLTKFNHPRMGEVTMPGSPVTFSKTPAGIQREAPELGQHSEEILLELGYDREEINRLKDTKVI